MIIKELKELIKDADENGEVWIQVVDERRFADCTASIDDNGVLTFFDSASYG